MGTEHLGLDLVWATLNRMTVQFVAHLPYIIGGLIAFSVVQFARRPAVSFVRRAGKRAMNPNLALAMSRLVNAALTIAGLLVASAIIFPGFRPADLVAGLGLTSLAVGFAFKDILQNFFAGLLILWTEPFTVGDEIRSGDFAGTVEEITTRSTLLRTAAGERVMLPNADIYTRPIIILGAAGKRRTSFVITLNHAEDVDRARDIIRSVLGRAGGVLAEPPPLAHVTEFTDVVARIGVYFWVDTKRDSLLAVTDRLLVDIREELARADIHFGPRPVAPVSAAR